MAHRKLWYRKLPMFCVCVHAIFRVCVRAISTRDVTAVPFQVAGDRGDTASVGLTFVVDGAGCRYASKINTTFHNLRRTYGSIYTPTSRARPFRSGVFLAMRGRQQLLLPRGRRTKKNKNKSAWSLPSQDRFLCESDL